MEEEGFVQNVNIFLSRKEIDKSHLWLRPFEGQDGYELLYYGANGWTPLLPTEHKHLFCKADELLEDHKKK